MSERYRKPSQKRRNEQSSLSSYVSLSISKQKEDLPIFQCRNHLLYLLEQYRTVVVSGETGSGKSTQIPQFLATAGWPDVGKTCIGVTQPNHIAAVSVASRVADEMGTTLGKEVGYEIRFENCCNPQEIAIKYMTDGILLQEIMKDPSLKKFCIVVVDEVHVRNISTDLCLGLLKKIQVKRPDLRIVISSATYDAEKMKAFFESGKNAAPNAASILWVPTKRLQPEIFYTSLPVANYIQQMADTILKIHFNEKTGDILAFVTGQQEVEEVSSLLKVGLRSETNTGKYLSIFPLYASLPMAEQNKVFGHVPKHVRKVIVSTNVAETSLTIPRIGFVVDCGFVKMKMFNPEMSIESVVTCPASKASLEQRAGRCGRTRTGKVYRLFEESQMHDLPESVVPEIQRCNLVPIIIRLKALGVDNILNFKFLSPPPAYSVMRGLEYLYAMGALDKEGNLTSNYGRRMSELPLAPHFVKMIVDSEKFRCSSEIITIVAMLMVKGIVSFLPSQRKAVRKSHSKFAVEQGDHVTLLNVFNAFTSDGNSSNPGWCKRNHFNYSRLQQAVKTKHQLRKFLDKMDIALISCTDEVERIQKCVASGLFANVAQLQMDGSYRGLLNGQSLALHPSSVLTFRAPPAWIVYSEIVRTSHHFMKDLTVVEPHWLQEIAPRFFGAADSNADEGVSSAKRVKYS